MIVVIGAGPAGLAVAYELQQRGLAYQVLERHSVGYAWQNHYDRLHLHTLKQVSALPGLPLPADDPDFPSREQFLAYLERYAGHFALRITEGVELRYACFTGGAWRLDTSSGHLWAKVLVMATGIWSVPLRPVLPGETRFGGMILHSRDYRNPRAFEGKRVLVIGAGNSGTEIAVDLATAGVQTSIAVRSGVAFARRPRSATLVRGAAWLLRTLPRALAGRVLRRRDFSYLGLPLPPGLAIDHYPVIGYELPRAVAAGRIAVVPGVERLSPATAHFTGGRAAHYDAIILATGYRPALDPVAHEIELDAHGRPRLDRYWRSPGNPRLVCVGYAYPTTEGWIQSIGRVARAAVDGIVELNLVHT